MRREYYTANGYDFDGYTEWKVLDLREEDRPLVRALEFFCKPAAHDLIVQELAKLRAVMARRSEVGDDMTLSLAVMADDLAEYPADVVRQACTALRQAQTFYPTISELRAACGERFDLRRRLLAALLAAEQAMLAPAALPPTPAQKTAIEKIQDEIAELEKAEKGFNPESADVFQQTLINAFAGRKTALLAKLAKIQSGSNSASQQEAQQADQQGGGNG